jgi:hypothetical protein
VLARDDIHESVGGIDTIILAPLDATAALSPHTPLRAFA